MKRVYSTYNDLQIEMLKSEAEKRHMTMSEYQRYLVLLELPTIPNVTHNITQLINDMFVSLTNIENSNEESSYNPFIVSSLFDSDVWSSLDATDKRTLAMKLSHYIRKNPNRFEKVGMLPGKISQYRKK